MMETKVPDFVSAMSRTIKCNHHSKLLVNQQGLFYTVKKKQKRYSLEHVIKFNSTEVAYCCRRGELYEVCQQLPYELYDEYI